MCRPLCAVVQKTPSGTPIVIKLSRKFESDCIPGHGLPSSLLSGRHMECAYYFRDDPRFESLVLAH